MAKLSTIKIDNDKASGIWVEYSLDIKLKIASLRNKGYQAFIRKEGKEYQVQIAHGVLNDEALEPIFIRALAKHVLVDWKNIEDDDGSPIPYSQEKAEEILANPEYRDLLDFVMATAQDRERYRVEVDEAIEGN